MGELFVDDCSNCFESRTMVELVKATNQQQYWARAKRMKQLCDDMGATCCLVQADAVLALAPRRTHRLNGLVVRILETLLVCK